MSGNGSLKRKSIEMEDVVEDLSEPESKQIKIDTPTTKPNLEISPITPISKDDTKDRGSVVDEPKSGPCSISIKFQDDVIANLYKSQFLQFISSFAEFQVKNTSDSDLIIDVYRNEPVVTNEIEVNTAPDEVINDSSPKKNRKKHSKIKKELFVVDATPSPNVAQTDFRYTTKFTINTEKGLEEVPTRAFKFSSCFNCNELHSLKDCPHPKDYHKINMARQKFKDNIKPTRYHLEDNQRFNHLEPGKVSNELRKALGLHRNEAPHFIYLMRKLGYPPGWLEEAKFVHSNLDIFDIDGHFVKTATVKKQGLDENKIVEYPGFNVPLQKGVKDDHRMYRVPPYCDDFSKKAMIDFFEKKFAQEEDNLETCDMDIEHDPDCSNVNQEKAPEIKASAGRCSPSLVDLEQQKLQLLEELNDEPKTAVKSFVESDSDKDVSVVKTSCFGTPILKSSSPYVSLPDPDNFSKDVSPVINFENLPNSTGKYEQLTDVLQKVRNTLKKINNCNT